MRAEARPTKFRHLGRLKSRGQSKIVKAGREVAMMFRNVGVGDEVVKGVIMAHESPHIYECCGACKRAKFRNEKGDKCIFCGDALADGRERHEFNVVLLVLDEGKGEVCRISVFRSDLGMEFDDMSEESIENEMIKLHMKQAVLDFSLRSLSSNVFM